MEQAAQFDHPLDFAKDDELARDPFATLVAAALLQRNDLQATVVAVTGGWGTGKSTVANFVAEKIGATADIVRFNPWMVDTPEALVREFMKALGKTILPKGDTPEAKEARSRFYKYAALVMNVASVGAQGIGVVAPFAIAVGKGLSQGQKMLDAAAKGLETQARLPTLQEAKEAVCKQLKGIEKPVVVIIDDIDRLDHAEVRAVFKTIKACADFPNLRYLLLYDVAQVTEALAGSRSEQFLEKIVGLTFDLPEATAAQRETILCRYLYALPFGELDQKSRSRIDELAGCVLLPGLPTLRLVKRFFAAVDALLPGVIVDG